MCDQCRRAQSACICHWIRPVEHQVEVLFLQHPLEVNNAKNSARLLHLSLPHSRMTVGEKFDADELQHLLYDSSNERTCTVHPVLLYPDTSADHKVSLPPPWPEAADSSDHVYRLVVLDATWRKSRKMLYLNPMLQQLPRLPLADMPASHYAIRKAHKPDQLSSFEATCHALMQLENDADKYLPLLTAFDGFVAQQQAYRPETQV
ncbi:tRNA-uridine aminocarboxypropyltransferase [Herminiimonas sp. KBW02]|uniref:tRNA-uridine aminocarboxypropyltransferase n=1 Tax=Herminiimonas sp. KBW02 TaxID=2153363 RepID=UPI001F28972C|nr:tRNA-uridine aminocarboxypropyltransferase [Herminiimonas sp. KBW02]